VQSNILACKVFSVSHFNLFYRDVVAGSIPNGVIRIFRWYNPSGRTRALGSTQPLTEMSTKNISWEVKAAGV
jgi:hypothetical protein